jgi:hypothetical protein
MTERPAEEDKLVDLELVGLADVYAMLKRDAKDMLQYLLDGVSLWRYTARMLLGVAALAFGLVPLFAWGASSTSPSPVSTGLGLIAIFMTGLGLITSLTGMRYRGKYSVLRKKYSELYETAKKLS